MTGTLHVRCECGAGLKLDEQKAGRTGRCPSCKRTIQIPAASLFERHAGARMSLGDLETLSGSAPQERTDGDGDSEGDAFAMHRPLVVTCSCGKAQTFDFTRAGEKLPCPGCQSIVPLPDRGVFAHYARRPLPLAELVMLDSLKQALVIEGDCKEVEAVGIGGMGIVFRGDDTRLATRVAVKTGLARMTSSQSATNRFLKEVEHWIELEPHPNVVQAHKVEMYASRPFLFLEWVDGGNLRQWLDTHDPRDKTSLARRIDLAIGICRGVAHAHAAGLIHRDLKPANILVMSDGVAKVTDFGLVKQTQQQMDSDPSGEDVEAGEHLAGAGLTVAGKILGTPEYMAPEQFHDAASVTAQADVYAVGVVLYELFSGRLPLETPFRNAGERIARYASLHATAKPQSLDQVVPDLPAAIADAVSKCLVKQPAERRVSLTKLVTLLRDRYRRVTDTEYERPEKTPAGDHHKGRRGWSYQALARIAHFRGEQQSARQRLEQARSCFENSNDRTGVSQVLYYLGWFTGDQGDYAEARRLYEESLAISRELGNRATIANTLHCLGILASNQGDYGEARRLYDESLVINRDLGNRATIANTLHCFGSLTEKKGDDAEARRFYEESLAINRELGNRATIAITLHDLGVLAWKHGDCGDARRLYEESLAINRELGNRATIANTLHCFGLLAVNQGDNGEARRLYEESLAINRELGNRATIADTLHCLGLLAWNQGDRAAARRRYEESLAISRELSKRATMASTLYSLGHVDAAENHWGTAARHYEEAAKLYEHLENSEYVEKSKQELAKANRNLVQ